MNEKTLEIARECGACFPYPLGEKYGPQVVFIPADFERLANRMKAEGMLEAADKCFTLANIEQKEGSADKFSVGFINGAKDCAYELRCMAAELVKGE